MTVVQKETARQRPTAVERQELIVIHGKSNTGGGLVVGRGACCAVPPL
jgi:hypothetical protein